MNIKLAAVNGRSIQSSYAERTDTAEQAMSIIRDQLYAHHPKDVADATGLSLGAIYAIRRNATKWPRPNTFFSLIHYLDLEMFLQKRTQ